MTSTTPFPPLLEPSTLHLLIAEDDPADLALTLRALKTSGLDLHIETVATRLAFAEALNSGKVDMVLSDYRMCDWTGIDALTEVIKFDADIPVILITGTLGDLKAVECMRLGVTDYVLKHQIVRLPMAIMRAREERALRRSQKHAAEALRESEAHYRTLVESAPEAIVILDLEKGRFVDCNNKALRLFRVSRDELLVRNPEQLSPPFQPDGRRSIVAAQLWAGSTTENEPWSFEWTHRNSMGTDVPCEVHLVRLASPVRQLVRGSILDITERKRSEDAVRESEARYRDLVNNAMYGIYWVSSDGTLLHSNPALVRMLGYDSIESLLAARDTGILFCDPVFRERVLAENGTADRVDFTVDWKRRDDKIITVRLMGRRARDPRSKTACIEVIVEELTERLTLEKQIRQFQKFEAIGQLAGGIAHDFNNMIGAILGWAEVGLDESDADTRLHRHFDKIRHQALRAADLTRQLLAFARRQLLETRDIDLNQNITETLNLLEKLIGSNIEITKNLAPNLPTIRADATQIQQVIMNLCINARDAMPEGGRLLIETGECTFDDKYLAAQPHVKPGRYAMVAVTDSGTGMNAATIDRIFEPFFTTKEMGKGTGLGLATVYGIVRQHGGFLHVYSEVNIGTTFRVYLPVAAIAGTIVVPTEDLQPMRGGAEMILLAEDHEGLRELARETLEALGYRVLTVCDGEAALAEFDKHRGQIDLLLFDVELPKLSGPKAYARICSFDPEVPVVFATGYSADIEMLQEIRRQGITVLQKPYVPRDLARGVREALDRHSAKMKSASGRQKLPDQAAE
jgi:two-component system, cell cycle sensor histidine kinase and response regulator CckA